jgi:hypothetical protein
MPDDPFEAWREGRPFGQFRHVARSSQGLAAVPVLRDANYRAYAANSCFVWSEPTQDGARFSVSFDNVTKKRDFVFLPEPEQSHDQPSDGDTTNDRPRPFSGVVTDAVVEVCSVDMTPSAAAQLAKLLVERLAENAPEALLAVGLEFRRDANG